MTNETSLLSELCKATQDTNMQLHFRLLEKNYTLLQRLTTQLEQHSHPSLSSDDRKLHVLIRALEGVNKNLHNLVLVHKGPDAYYSAITHFLLWLAQRDKPMAHRINELVCGYLKYHNGGDDITPAGSLPKGNHEGVEYGA